MQHNSKKSPGEPIKLHFPNLLKEWDDSNKRAHAIIVHQKCLRAGKTALAEKIRQKYSLRTKTSSDRLTAFMMALATAHCKIDNNILN